ncbi:MAG: hypothetical protein D6677_12760 [Calditrichaeota bacterium]|nr:MAG: hypothetical protein D6677_12760 [Calditrichota bacterium]
MWWRDVINQTPEIIDLTDDQQAQQVYKTVDGLLKRIPSLDTLDQLEDELWAHPSPRHTFFLLCLKIARSKMLTRTINAPLRVSIVFAVYKEHNRLRGRNEHPHGENFIIKKAEQLNYLFGDIPGVNWKLYVVDDGCPENSGRIAREIVSANGLSDKIEVLFLQDGIDKGIPPVNRLTSTHDSQKGGSILFGMGQALKEKGSGTHIIMFTDADLSTHLGQAMLLIRPLLQGQKAAIASRREPTSVVIKQGTRNDRGKLFIYLWKRLLPRLNRIVDTQCGFKAFRSEIIPHLIHDPLEYKFAFDIELLLKTESRWPQSIEKVPIAWIDSEAASTTTDLQPYLPMLKSIAKMYRRYEEPRPDADGFAHFIEMLDESAFECLLGNIPPAIRQGDPATFDTLNTVTVKDLEEAAGR